VNPLKLKGLFSGEKRVFLNSNVSHRKPDAAGNSLARSSAAKEFNAAVDGFLAICLWNEGNRRGFDSI
jgi:hypothetical protein